MENCFLIYLQYNIDVFIYDSSDNRLTEYVVEKWKKYVNIHYIKIDSFIHSNVKVYNIFKEFSESLNYEYIWICADYIRWTPNVLEKVSLSILKGYDMIIVNHRDVEDIGDKIYSNKNILFEECAWCMTLYGATILKISTMLLNVQWNKLFNKYMTPECIYHSHVALIFEQLNVMENYQVIHLSLNKNDFICSNIVKISGWKKDIFYVWCYCWPEMIKKLPKTYQNKNIVIKKHGVNSKILSYEKLKEFRKENILNFRIYLLYANKWHTLTDVCKWKILALSIMPLVCIKKIEQKQINERWLKNKIKRFCKKYKTIYIYGAGKNAERYTKYFEALEIEFEAYIISNLVDGLKMLNGHKVIVYSPQLLHDKYTGVLLALNEINTKQVMQQVLGNIEKKRIFSEYNLKN